MNSDRVLHISLKIPISLIQQPYKMPIIPLRQLIHNSMETTTFSPVDASSKANRQKNDSPDHADDWLTSLKQMVGTGAGNKKKGAGTLRFAETRSPFYSAARITRWFRGSMRRIVRVSPMRRSSSNAVSVSSSIRQSSVVGTEDSQRAEAIKDCIEFFKSSSKRSRTDSTDSCFEINTP